MYDKPTFLDQLIEDEGYRQKPYFDTAGKLTIGIGRNLDDNGITRHEAGVLALNDIESVEGDLDRNIPWWRELSDNRQMVFVNMCFNLGWPRLSKFRRMIAAAGIGEFEAAADEMLDSKWARKDVQESRSHRLAKMMREG